MAAESAGQVRQSDQPGDRLRWLLTGVGMIAIALLVGYLMVLDVDKARGTGELRLSMKGQIAVPILVGMGEFLVLIGLAGDGKKPTTGFQRVMGKLIALLMFVAVPASVVLLVVWWVGYVHEAGFNLF